MRRPTIGNETLAQQDRDRASLDLEVGSEEEEFVAFVAKHFDPLKYLEINTDVAKAGMDPLQHWLNHGLGEGRPISPHVEVRCGKDAESFYCKRWSHYRWRNQTVAVRILKSIPAEIMSQIFNQARHDPAILAPGLNAIANLRQFDAADFVSRDGLDFDGLFAAIPRRPEILIIMPRMGVGGAAKFSACLVAALTAAGYRSIQVLVTDQASSENTDWREFSILEPFRSVNVLHWRDVCLDPSSDLYGRGISRDPSSEAVLALLVNGLRPRIAIVVDSRMGFNMVARFGCGLSQHTRLYCAYFGFGMPGLGGDHGLRFPRGTLRFATALTDSRRMAITLRDRYGSLLGGDIEVLSPRITPVDGTTFNKRLSERRQRVVSAASPTRWVWVGRIESSKGTQILSRLARLRHFDCFEIFGPLGKTLESLGLALPNVVHRGVLKDVTTADFSDYDGFLFTSLSDGISNVVLEMSQHAIPLVLSKAGGTPETFDEEAAFFIDPAEEDAAVTAFSLALDQVKKMTADRAVAMAVAACNQAQKRHSPEAFARTVESLFGRPL
jgi:hypothetical protein